MSINKRLFDILDEKKLNNSDLAKGTGIKANTISDWRNKGTNPSSDKIYRICEFLNISTDYLLEGIEPKERNKINRYNKLTIDRSNLMEAYDNLKNTHKERILERIETYLESEEYQLNETNNITYLDNYKKRPFKDFAITMSGLTAAGQAIMYPDLYSFSDIVEVPQGIKADFALTVKGDSMEPQIQNGSIIYVRKTEYVENGTISIIELDGAVTCKKFYKFSDRIELISINSQYKPIIIKESDHIDIKIIGKVVF